MLTMRILSAAVLVPLVVLGACLGGWWFAGLVSLFAALAVIEFYQLARKLGLDPSVVVGTLLSIGVVLAAQLPNARIAPALFTAALATLMLVSVIRQDFDRFLGGWAVTITGSAYVGGLLSHFVLLRNLEQGLAWVVLTAAVTWLGDTGAYLVGTAIGRRPFFPRVSPRKTLEGAIGGVLIGTLAGVAVGILWLRLSWPVAAALGLLTSLAATFGDLAESLVKRQAGAKDSGNLIPGHGGALDRVDSLLFAGAVVYHAALWLSGAH